MCAENFINYIGSMPIVSLELELEGEEDDRHVT